MVFNIFVHLSRFARCCKPTAYSFQTPLSLFSFSVPFSFFLAYVDYGSLSVFTVSSLYNSLILDLLCDSDLFWVFPAIQQVSSHVYIICMMVIFLLVFYFALIITYTLVIVIHRYHTLLVTHALEVHFRICIILIDTLYICGRAGKSSHKPLKV